MNARLASLLAGTALALASFSSLHAADAERGTFDFGAFAPSAQGRYVEVNVQSSLLKFAAKIAAAKEPEAAQVLGNIKHVRVNVVGLDATNRESTIARMTAVRAELEKQGWEKVVVAREPSKNGTDDVAVYLQADGETIHGVVVTVIEAKGEAVFVNVVGHIRAEDLSKLGEKLDIKQLKRLKGHQAAPTAAAS